MSQPPLYSPATSFITYQAQQAWFPGQQLDVEFNAIDTSITAIEHNLALIQKDDGTLANGIVDWENLAADLQAQLIAQGFIPPTPPSPTPTPTTPYVTPESYGAVGDGTTDDTVAIGKMTDAGRAAGGLFVILSPGKTYTCINPYTFSGIPYLTIDGQGASWRNIRPGSGNNIVGFTTNYDALVLGSTPFLSNGPSAYVGTNNQGIKIQSASAGTTSFTTLDGSTPKIGRCIIFGFDRQGSASFPPCCSCFEYAEIISVVGAVATLRSPLKFDYDQTWPETSFNPSAKFTASIDQTGLMTVTAVASGTVTPGTFIAGLNIPFFMSIASYGINGTSGVGSTGTYQLKNGASNSGAFAVLATSIGSQTIYGAGENVYGAARYISLEADTDINPSGQGKVAYLRNINFVDNPGFPTGNSSIFNSSNGRLTLSGFDRIYAENIRSSVGYLSSADIVQVTGWTVNERASIGVSLELDKMVTRVQLNKVNSQPSAGLGIYDVEINDCIAMYGSALCPINTARLTRGIFGGTAVGDTASAIGMFLNKGPRNFIVEDTRIVVTNSATDRLFRVGAYTLTLDVSASAPTIVMTRAAYNTSNICTGIYRGAVFTDANGVPKFRVTKLPYCSGDPVTGNVSIDGDFLQAIAGSDTLYLSATPAITIENPIIDGPFFKQVVSSLSNQPTTMVSPYPVMYVRDKWVTDSTVQLSSEMTMPNRASHFYSHYLGRLFIISKVIVHVTKAAGSAATLNLAAKDGGGTSRQIIQAIDLTTTGRREISALSITTLGSDIIGSPNGPPAQTAMEINFTDTSDTQAAPGPAQWTATFEGEWAARYGDLS